MKLSQEDAGGPRDEAGKWHHGGMTPPKDCEREQTFEAEECALRSMINDFDEEWRRCNEIKHNKHIAREQRYECL